MQNWGILVCNFVRFQFTKNTEKKVEQLSDSEINAEIMLQLCLNEINEKNPQTLVTFLKDMLQSASRGRLSDESLKNTLKILVVLKEKLRVEALNDPDSSFFPKALSEMERFESELNKRYVKTDGPVTDAIETNLGKNMKDSLLKQYPLASEENQKLVQELAQKVFKLARRERRYGTYEIYAIEMTQDGKDVPNAFCTPGGYVFVTTGLMKIIDNNPDVISFVIGHEAGHHVYKDTAKKLKRTLGLLPLNLIPGMKKLLAKYLEAPLGRKAEYRADLYGTVCNEKISLNARAGIEFLVKLTELFGNLEPDDYEVHPSNSDRIKSIEKHLKSQN